MPVSQRSEELAMRSRDSLVSVYVVHRNPRALLPILDRSNPPHRTSESASTQRLDAPATAWTAGSRAMRWLDSRSARFSDPMGAITTGVLLGPWKLGGGDVVASSANPKRETALYLPTVGNVAAPCATSHPPSAPSSAMGSPRISTGH